MTFGRLLGGRVTRGAVASAAGSLTNPAEPATTAAADLRNSIRLVRVPRASDPPAIP